jgi:hypothetical protein
LYVALEMQQIPIKWSKRLFVFVLWNYRQAKNLSRFVYFSTYKKYLSQFWLLAGSSSQTCSKIVIIKNINLLNWLTFVDEMKRQFKISD